MRRAVDPSGEAELRMREQGYMPVRSQNTMALGWRVEIDRSLCIETNAPGARLACQALGMHHTTRHTRPIGHKGAAEVWVKAEDHVTLRAVFAAARLLAYPSFPEMARRFAANPELFRVYEASWRLGANDETLRAILEPLKRPLKKKRGPRL